MLSLKMKGNAKKYLLQSADHAGCICKIGLHLLNSSSFLRLQMLQ